MVQDETNTALVDAVPQAGRGDKHGAGIEVGWGAVFSGAWHRQRLKQSKKVPLGSERAALLACFLPIAEFKADSGIQGR